MRRAYRQVHGLSTGFVHSGFYSGPDARLQFEFWHNFHLTENFSENVLRKMCFMLIWSAHAFFKLQWVDQEKFETA